ncbi:MAG: HEAT repeat domain-containing protein [Verrucomicrobiota bacterium]
MPTTSHHSASKRIVIFIAGLVCIAVVLVVQFTGPGSEEVVPSQPELVKRVEIIDEQMQASRASVRKVMKAASTEGKEWDVIGAVNSLGSSLSEEECRELAQSLMENLNEELFIGISAVDFNSVLNLLRANGYAEPALFEYLAQTFRNDGLSIELRDYAVQHTEAWLRELDRTTGRLLIEDIDLRRAAASMLLEAVGYAEESFSGTAASALSDLSFFHPDEIDPVGLDASILHLLEGEGVHSHSRITAIQLAAERRLEGAIPFVRGVVHDEAIDPSTRLVAIGALGALGDGADIKSLQSARGPNGTGRFDRAIAVAVSRIAARYEAGGRTN